MSKPLFTEHAPPRWSKQNAMLGVPRKREGVMSFIKLPKDIVIDKEFKGVKWGAQPTVSLRSIAELKAVGIPESLTKEARQRAIHQTATMPPAMFELYVTTTNRLGDAAFLGHMSGVEMRERLDYAEACDSAATAHTAAAQRYTDQAIRVRSECAKQVSTTYKFMRAAVHLPDGAMYEEPAAEMIAVMRERRKKAALVRREQVAKSTGEREAKRTAKAEAKLKKAEATAAARIERARRELASAEAISGRTHGQVPASGPVAPPSGGGAGHS